MRVLLVMAVLIALEMWLAHRDWSTPVQEAVVIGLPGIARLTASAVMFIWFAILMLGMAKVVRHDGRWEYADPLRELPPKARWRWLGPKLGLCALLWIAWVAF